MVIRPSAHYRVLAKAREFLTDLGLPDWLNLSPAHFPAPTEFTFERWTQRHELPKPFWGARHVIFSLARVCGPQIIMCVVTSLSLCVRYNCIKRSALLTCLLTYYPLVQ